MLYGSCMCGKVRFEISAPPLLMYHCHCSICRAASGASFVTNVIVKTTDFVVVAGQDSLGSYESSPGKRRCFCSSCGSPIYSHGQQTRHVVSVRSGTLKEDPGIRPSYHAYVASKAAWVDLRDGLPRYPEGRT